MTDGRSGARPEGQDRPSTTYSGAETGSNSLAEKLRDIARILQNESGVEETLQAIIAAATDTVPGAKSASISVLRKRRVIETLAATDHLARAADQAQTDAGEGPYLGSVYERRTVRLLDMSAETRWPKFATRAREIGLGSMLVVRLFVTGKDLGALNLHSAESGAFTDESEEVGLLFAGHAAIAMVGAHEQAQLTTAVNSRDLIGQAKGILMERYKISADEAFRTLVVASQSTNIRLVDVAGQLIRTGLLASREPQPGPPSGPNGRISASPAALSEAATAE